MYISPITIPRPLWNTFIPESVFRNRYCQNKYLSIVLVYTI